MTKYLIESIRAMTANALRQSDWWSLTSLDTAGDASQHFWSLVRQGDAPHSESTNTRCPRVERSISVVRSWPAPAPGGPEREECGIVVQFSRRTSIDEMESGVLSLGHAAAGSEKTGRVTFVPLLAAPQYCYDGDGYCYAVNSLISSSTRGTADGRRLRSAYLYPSVEQWGDFPSVVQFYSRNRGLFPFR